ncbi:hypothetical protein EV426DRAFT_576838 [Tirmania nivea]|nr:hypothetical protein EV426DRAFT_576838 [Tirmania nivea]
MAVKKSFTHSIGTTTGHINGVLLDTNLSSVLLRDPIPSITSEWVAIGDGIPEVPMSAIGDSGGLLTDDDNAIVGMIIGGLRNRRVEVNGNVGLVDNLTVLTSAEELLQWIKFDLGRDVVFAGYFLRTLSPVTASHRIMCQRGILFTVIILISFTIARVL